MAIVDCLFDTNAIIKRYHDEPGTVVVDYLFEKSPAVKINLLNIQVAEVIKTFYSLRSRGKLSDDQSRDTLVDTFLKDIDTGDGSRKIKLYDFANEHLKDMDVYGPITNISTRTVDVWNKITGQKAPRQKAPANTVDLIMIIVMREIKYLTGESYLVTSDEHVIDVAQSLGISVINPEKALIGNLPSSLDIRTHKRRRAHLKVICKDPQNSQSLGTTTTEDICKTGLKVRGLQHLSQGRLANFRIESLCGERRSIETWGEVCWSKPGYCGIRLADTISDDFLNAITESRIPS